MGNQTENVNRQLGKGAAWMVLFKLVEKSIGLISTVILARLLVPEDFGLVAMAMIVVAFIELMRAFNFDVALIQNQSAVDDHYNTAWTFNVGIGVVISILMLISAPFVAEFYGDYRLEDILYVLAIGVFISGFENIGVVAFRKDLTFHKEFYYLLGKKLISFATAISLALYWGNYWALIGGILASQIGVVALSYWVHAYRPVLCLSKRKELLGFSIWLLINNILYFINNKVAEIFVGKLSGASALGVFSVGYEIANMPTTDLVAPINRAAFPAYSKLNNDEDALRSSYFGTISYIALIALPAALGLSVMAPYVVGVLLGDQWGEAIPIVEIVALAGAIMALQTNAGALFMAVGKPFILTGLTLFRVVILVPSVWYGVTNYDVIGAAYAVLFVGLAVFPIGIFMILRTIKASLFVYLKCVYRPIMGAIIMAVGLTYLLPIFQKLMNNMLFEMIALILTGIVMYCFITLLLWWLAGKNGVEGDILRALRQRLNARAKR